MAQHTFTLDAGSEAVLLWVVEQNNTQRELNLTEDQYIATSVGNLLAPFVLQYQAYVLALVTQQFANADPATQAQVQALLAPK